MTAKKEVSDGSKSMQVLETGTETAEHRVLVPRQRPTSVSGITDRVRTGHGSMYVTVNFDDRERPFEVFTTLGKAGGCDSAQLEAISRLVSLALRSGIDPGEVVDHLRGITCCPVWDSGTLVRSAADAVALVLNRQLQEDGEQGWHKGDHGATNGAAQLGLFPSNQGKGAVHGNQPVLTGARCPECSGSLIHQEGCLRCLDCGYNKCE